MENNLDGVDIPLGFGMLLAQDANALARFASLPEDRKQAILDGAHHVSSREEMEAYIRQLTL